MIREYPEIGLVWLTDFDPSTDGGVPAPLYQFLIRLDDATLWYKSGPASTDWTEIGGGGSGPAKVGIQSYRFICTGAETTAGFAIPLQTARADAAYNAIVTLLKATFGGQPAAYSLGADPAGYTTTQFTCLPGDTPQAGDIIAVEIIPLT